MYIYFIHYIFMLSILSVVYMFEDNMPDEECAIVDQLCQNMGLGSQFIG